jgi:hypothetical protein
MKYFIENKEKEYFIQNKQKKKMNLKKLLFLLFI